MSSVAAGHLMIPFLLVFMHGCGCWYTADPPEVDLATDLADVRVIPSTVFVVPGAVFVMRARMVDDQGGVLSEHPQLDWTVGTDLAELDRGGDSITLKAAVVTASTVTAGVKAVVGTWGAGATITILAPGAGGTPDSSLGDNRNRIVPDLLLMDNPSGATPIDDSLIAFVGIGLLGDVAGGSGEVWRFANDQSFRMQPVAFRTTTDIVGFRSPGGGPNPNALLQPSYTLWIATSAYNAHALALDDVKLAATIFGRERTGLALKHKSLAALGSGPYTMTSGTNPCAGQWTKLQALGIPATAVSFKPESLNVVYVDDLLDPPSSDAEIPVSALLTGYACPADPAIGAVILIAQRWKGTSTLTHELGHAFGLREPNGGHPAYVPGFSYTNMMWPREGDGSGVPRGHFTLGQAFRINLDDHSWLPLPAASRIDCDVLEINRACPPLATDPR